MCDGDEGRAEVQTFSNARHGNPIDQLRDNARGHQAKAELFRVMAEHVIKDEIYRLSERDLTQLELIAGSLY